jgi:biotin operon repressor
LPADERFFSVLNAVKAVRSMPDGSPCPHGLKATWIGLATYYPNIFPGQERLAVDLCITRSNVNKRMRRLEDSGLIVRVQPNKWEGASTLYRLKLATIRKCAAEPVSLPTHYLLPNGTESEGAVDEGEWW